MEDNRLSPEDFEFFSRVSGEVKSSNALPFDIPPERLPKIVIKALKWFWEFYDEATYEESYYIPVSEINKGKKDQVGNKIVYLPNTVEGISDIKPVSGATGLALKDILKIPLLQTYGSGYRSTYGSDPGSSGATDSHYGYPNYQISNMVISMFEYDTYQNVFKKGIKHSFNKNTGKLNIIGKVDGAGIVLDVFTRLQPEEMYNDYYFEEYCIGKVMEELGKIVTTFQFNFPGEITINYDQIKQDGTEKVEKIKEEIKDQNVNGMLRIF